MCLVEVEGSPKPVRNFISYKIYSLLHAPQMSDLISKSLPNLRKQELPEGKNISSNHYYRGVMEFLLANHPLDCPICD